jgi:hypothetical protein
MLPRRSLFGGRVVCHTLPRCKTNENGFRNASRWSTRLVRQVGLGRVDGTPSAFDKQRGIGRGHGDHPWALYAPSPPPDRIGPRTSCSIPLAGSSNRLSMAAKLQIARAANVSVARHPEPTATAAHGCPAPFNPLPDGRGTTSGAPRRVQCMLATVGFGAGLRPIPRRARLLSEHRYQVSSWLQLRINIKRRHSVH